MNIIMIGFCLLQVHLNIDMVDKVFGKDMHVMKGRGYLCANHAQQASKWIFSVVKTLLSGARRSMCKCNQEVGFESFC